MDIMCKFAYNKKIFMSKVNIVLPRMGQGVEEAVLIEYKCAVGDTIAIDDVVAEIATDKVDTEITSHVSGVVIDILFKKDDVIRVGQVVAVIDTPDVEKEESEQDEILQGEVRCEGECDVKIVGEDYGNSSRFYSPLVRQVARVEGIPLAELEQVKGTGLKGRVTKDDILSYVKAGREYKGIDASARVEDEVIPMSRMRRLIAENMKHSIEIAAHATSFSQVDVTELSIWRKRIKVEFEGKYGEHLTYTPIFMMAIARALEKNPMINSQIDGDNVILHRDINIGMAVATPEGELIVPIIHSANALSLPQMASKVNDLASRARSGKLRPHEITGGTFTLTNVGTFGTLFGTPIINLPQVAILAIGTIEKLPAVLCVDGQDVIAIREKMYMSMSYDHRVIDGGLAGKFMKDVADYLCKWDKDKTID